LEDIKLSFADDALDFMVEKALEYNLGARGLRSICEAIMTDAMYEMPSATDTDNFEIDRLYCEEKFSKTNIEKLMAA
jgi:ATP-dependent Clp protease ATP-binding subunit ClpX